VIEVAKSSCCGAKIQEWNDGTKLELATSGFASQSLTSRIERSRLTRSGTTVIYGLMAMDARFKFVGYSKLAHPQLEDGLAR
jgi:hypothetical protein